METKICPKCKSQMVLRSGITNGKKWTGYFCEKCKNVEWIDLRRTKGTGTVAVQSKEEKIEKIIQKRDLSIRQSQEERNRVIAYQMAALKINSLALLLPGKFKIQDEADYDAKLDQFAREYLRKITFLKTDNKENDKEEAPF